MQTLLASLGKCLKILYINQCAIDSSTLGLICYVFGARYKINLSVQISERFSPRQWMVFSALTMVLTMVLLDNVTTPLILPTLQNEFHLSDKNINWVMNAYYIGLSSFVLIGGRIADIFCRKKVLIYGLLIHILVCGFLFIVNHHLALYVGRGLQGASMAFVFPTATAIMIETFTGVQRGKAWGLSVALGTMATVIGPWIAGSLAYYNSWRIIFLSTPLLGTGAVILSILSLRSNKVLKHQSIDLWGAVYIACSMFTFTFLLMQSRHWQGEYKRYILIFLLCAASSIALYLKRRRVASLIDYSVIKNRPFFLCLSVILVAQLIMPLPIHWIKYLQEVLGYSPLLVGRIFAYALLPTIVAAPLAGFLTDRYHPKIPACVGFVCMIFAVVSFSLFFYDSGSLFLFFAFMLFFTGNAFIITSASATALSHPAAKSRGAAAGMYNTLRFFSYSLGLSVFTIVQSLVTKNAAYSRETFLNVLYFEHRGAIFLAIIGAWLTLVYLKPYKELLES